MAETPPDPHTNDLLATLYGLVGPIGSAFMGLLIRWSGDYRRSARWSWTRVLVEAPTAIGFGIIGGGLASYLRAPPEAAWGFAALLGNLGTRGFFDLVTDFLNRRK